MQKAALHISGVIFAIGAVGHVVHLITGIEIVFGGVILPMWISFSGAIIAAALAVWMAVAARGL